MCGGLQVGHFVERACLDEDDPLRPGFWHVGEHRRTTVRAEVAIDRLTAVARSTKVRRPPFSSSSDRGTTAITESADPACFWQLRQWQVAYASGGQTMR